MCGIVGIAYTDGRPIEREVLENMTGALVHRGPDDKGIFITRNSKLKTRNSKIHVGLGHRRLSIIDLSEAGHQPMCNEDGTVWITYNGEIYNFRELRSDLVGKGHVFSSGSDTEVIIHGYEEYGEGLFNKLNGMFAFGLWDDRKQVLYLVRDRYGQKPLYYWDSPKSIVFASELKSLIRHPALQKEIDIYSLSRYLLYEYVPAPHSIFKGVKKVLPGHFLKWQDAGPHIIPYWQIDFNGTATNRALPIPEIENQLIGLLKLSVERRLVSDVPLGVFLSGGIDSSSIVALMAELIPPEQIKTFSIGFREKSFDESSYASEVARQFGTDHHEQILTPGKMIDILPEVWDLLDEPFADASIIPTYLLSKFTRQFVTVALGGDGGDELFAGYDPFVAHIAARYYERIPGFIQNSIFRPLVQLMPVSTKNMSFDFKLKQFLKGVPYEPGVRNQVWLGSFSKEEQKDLFAPDIRRLLNGFDPYGDMHQACQEMEFRDPLDEIIFLYSCFYLQDDILAKVDRASMATSLEVRSPYLDVQFAEFANSLPSRLKLKGLNRKYILKKALEQKLPREILYRKKKGFGIPLAKWFKKELKTPLLDVFSPQRLKQEGFLNTGHVHKLLDDHFSGKKDNRKQIWTLFMFEMWRERFA
jgi:asparagine synthase (glutamine-hydrolysing)